MFIHVFFLFPETSQKPLEAVEEIFDYEKAGSVKYIGTPAWKTSVGRKKSSLERGNVNGEQRSTSGDLNQFSSKQGMEERAVESV